MFQHVLTSCRSGLRSRSFQALFILGLLTVGAAYLASEFSGRQPATVAVDVAISGVRFVALLLVVFWCQELVAREVERRTVLLALTYPVPRSYYLLGRYIGIITLAFLAIVVLGVLVCASAFLAGRGYLQSTPIDLGMGLWLTLLFIWLDVSVVAAFTILIATISVTPLLPLALGVAFALSARSMGTALAYLSDKAGGASDLAPTFGPLVGGLRWILPDLGRFDMRVAALYSQYPEPSAMIGPALNGLAYVAIMLSLAAILFRRRQFG